MAVILHRGWPPRNPSCSFDLWCVFFFFSSRRRHTRSVSAFLLNRSSDLLQRIFLMSSLMLLLVWLIFFMVLIKLLPILGTISGKTVKLMVLALICLGNNRQD